MFVDDILIFSKSSPELAYQNRIKMLTVLGREDLIKTVEYIRAHVDKLKETGWLKQYPDVDC